ncbi:MAG: alpha-hydroxy acid oxidase [Legionellales bacterium]
MVTGIIISNHGGRQLDDAISSLDALTSLSDEIKSKLDVYLDGGVRNGVDVFKAMALGAKAVLIGRAALYGLIVNGQQGLMSVLNIMNTELRECMHMMGCATIADITRHLLYSDDSSRS